MIISNLKSSIIILGVLFAISFVACTDKGTEPENKAPNITSPAQVTALIDSFFSYFATASDSDGTSPSIHFENIPSWTDTAFNRISGTPSETTPDTLFTVIASDGFLDDTLEVTVDVTDIVLTISYSEDIQPIFSNSCAGSSCHIGGSAGGLMLDSWTDLMAGGNSGDVVIPGNAPMSIIVRQLEGDLQPRMPLGGSPLSTNLLQDIRDWIDEGALNN